VAAGLRRLSERAPVHPSLNSVLTAGVTDGRIVVAEALPRGEPLQAAMQAGRRMPAAGVFALVRHIADALDAAARHGWNHGALHPADIFVDAPAVCLMGMGMTRIFEDAGVPRVPSDRYAAFERWSGCWDQRADVFSLAVIAFELLCGYPLDLSVHKSLQAMPQSRDVDLARLRAVLARALASDPGERYDDARSFASDLAHTLTGLQDCLEDQPDTSHAEPAAGSRHYLRAAKTAALAAADRFDDTVFRMAAEVRRSGARVAATLALAAAVAGAALAIAAAAAPATRLAERAARATGRAWSALSASTAGDTGRLYVSSTPPHAHLVIDGHDAGAGAATIANLPFGPHEIAFVLDGYQTVVRVLSFTPDNAEQRLHATLTEHAGDIVLRKASVPATRPARRRRAS
jgi:hypothetical protein